MPPEKTPTPHSAASKKPFRKFAVYILTGDVRRVVVRARDELHAGRLAEKEYGRCAGEPGEFFECDHEEVACHEIKEGES